MNATGQTPIALRRFALRSLATSVAIALLLVASPLPCSAQDASISEASPAAPASLWSRDGEDWPRMLGPHGDNRSNESGVQLEWPAGSEPKIVWTLPTGVGYANGVAAYGRFFQFDRFEDTERLTCVHAETGKVLWTAEAPVEYIDMYGYNNGPRCSPLVDGGQVFVHGVAGRLACYRVEDGKLLWQRDLTKDYHVVPNFFGVGSAPLVVGDLLWVMVGGSPKDVAIAPGLLDVAKPNGTAMVAFDRWTGEEKYRLGNDLASYSAPILATLNGKTWCLAFCRQGLIVFDPTNGQIADTFAWRSEVFESVNAASPIVRANEIWLTETYGPGSVKLERKDGKLKDLWRDEKLQKNQAMRAHWATPILRDRYLFGCSGRNEPDANLRCVDWETGKVQWQVRNRDRTTLLAVQDHFFVYGEYGQLALMKANPDRAEVVIAWDYEQKRGEDGRPLLEAPTWSPPVLSHGYLYLRGAKRVVCLDVRQPAP
ncbi:MAG: PQQ-binding-like beta-propeller repeat protein [Pirellulaceae bacterium]